MGVNTPEVKPGMIIHILLIGAIMDSRRLADTNMTPLLEIRLELVPPNIHFVPDFGYIREMIDSWMDEFLKIS